MSGSSRAARTSPSCAAPVVAGTGELGARNSRVPIAPSAAAAARASQTSRGRESACGRGAAVCEAAVTAAPGWRTRSSIATRASPTSRSRRRGSRSRQRSSSLRSPAGAPAGSADQSTSCRSTAASVSLTVSPAKRRAPVSISYSTTPKDHRSARLSTALPRACSGDMYAAVPRMIPAAVPVWARVGDCERSPPGAAPAPSPDHALARPKSRTFTFPSGVTLTLAGLRSRWTMPFSCASSRASAICRAISSASSTGMAPRFRRSARSSPSTSSIASAYTLEPSGALALSKP